MENRINCSIAEDLLPLYVDGVVSDDTKNVIELHLAGCSECQKKLENMSATLDCVPAKSAALKEAEAIKKTKRKLIFKRVMISLCSVATAVALLLGGMWMVFCVRFTVNYDPDAIKIKVDKCTDRYEKDGKIYEPEYAVYASCGLPYASYTALDYTDNETEKKVKAIQFNYTIYDKYFLQYFDKERYDLLSSPENEYCFVGPTDFLEKVCYIDSESFYNLRMENNDVAEYATQNGEVVWSQER